MIFQHDIRVGPPPFLKGKVNLLYADLPYGTGRKFEHYDDSRIEAVRLAEALIHELPSLLAPGGIAVLQCDWNINWIVRGTLEGESSLSFLNEIIWSYASGGAGQKKVPHKHDTLHVFYKKGGDYVFNVLREPYPRDYGGRAGFHPDGRMCTSVWNIPILSTTSQERTGYSTEKPPKLLERVLLTYSNPGDLVYDPCCGSGVTGVAAEATGREYFLSDISPVAVETARTRLP